MERNPCSAPSTNFCTNPSFQWIGILANDQGKVIENIDCLICHAPNYRREVVKREDGSLAWVPVKGQGPLRAPHRLPVEKASGLMIPVMVGPTFRTGNTMASALGGAKVFRGKELTAADVGYVEVERWLGLFHEVVPKAQALKCNDCHGATATRLDWKALGYRGDPQKTGGRKIR